MNKPLMADTDTSAGQGIVTKIPLTVLVLTYNEEMNIEKCLQSVTGWVANIFVVDSGSTDRTINIAKAYGAEVVTHLFETHASQWKWALENLPLKTD